MDNRAMVHAPAGHIHSQGVLMMMWYRVKLQEMSPMGQEIYTRLRH